MKPDPFLVRAFDKIRQPLSDAFTITLFVAVMAFIASAIKPPIDAFVAALLGAG